VYCGGTCKTLAYRARRSATIQAMADYLGSTPQRAEDAVELYGLAAAKRGLEQVGMVYDQSSRRWLIPAGALVEVTT
jgi:hypothetical protein